MEHRAAPGTLIRSRVSGNVYKVIYWSESELFANCVSVTKKGYTPGIDYYVARDVDHWDLAEDPFLTYAREVLNASKTS